MNWPKIHSAALDEALEVKQRYAHEDAELAHTFVRQLDSVLSRIKRHPRRYPLLETVRTRREIRRARLTRFPPVVVFEVIDDQPHVLAVMHPHRRPGYWRRRTT